MNVKDKKSTILEDVLDVPEHYGRLRGVGGHLSKIVYFKCPRGKSSYVELCNSQQKYMEAQEARIAKLEAVMYKITQASDIDTEEKGNCSVKNFKDDEILKFEEDDLEIIETGARLKGKVTLTLESGTNVGYGIVVKALDDPKNCMCVSVDEAMDEDALLPFPTSDCKSIGEAVGSHVAWPIGLLKMEEEQNKRKKSVQKKQPTFNYSTIPDILRVVYFYCKDALQGKGNIRMKLDEDVFGHERNIYVHIEDVEPFIELKPISYNCIAVYLGHLYNRVKDLKKSAQFRFVDPYNVGHIPCTKTDDKFVQEQIERRALELKSRLVGSIKDQLVIVPCNVGAHWILTVIDPHKEKVFNLDPLYTRNIHREWKQVVELALRMFNVENAKRSKKTPDWTLPKVPTQPDSYQCGYYVMRYMRDIIESDSTRSEMLGMIELFQRRSYVADDINTVRKEWAEYIQRYII